MKIFFIIIFQLLMNLSYSASPTTVYFFHGQGSDERVFSAIKLDSNFRIVYITYPIPGKGMSLPAYAQLISKQIDTSQPFIFIGMSLGGMICTELADILKPERVIIISSAKCRKELPFRYRFQKNISINKLVPKSWVKWGALILQPLVEPDRNKNKEIFKSMLKSKDAGYLKQTADMIINWERKQYNNGIIHIHGTKDHTIPNRNVTSNYIIKGGSHMMTLTRGKEINQLILSILNDKK
jgi:pimeloyl-ACP methyl ester carboxylesterase